MQAVGQLGEVATCKYKIIDYILYYCGVIMIYGINLYQLLIWIDIEP